MCHMCHHNNHHSCPIHGDHPCCSCTCPEHKPQETHEHGDFAHQMLEMADQAWMEVLKEKIKEQIIAQSGDKLDQLAKIVAASNNERWQHKLALHQIVHDYEDKVHSYFTQKK